MRCTNLPDASLVQGIVSCNDCNGETVPHVGRRGNGVWTRFARASPHGLRGTSLAPVSRCKREGAHCYTGAVRHVVDRKRDGKDVQMRLHKIAVAVAALSFAGVAAAAGNTTAGSTTNPSSNDQMTTRQTSPQSTQKSEQSTNQAGASQMGNSSSMSQGGSSEQGNPTEVRSAQQALKDKGFDVGTVDGQMGPNTENALRQFQQKQGLPQTGNLDEQTLSALGVEQNQGAASSQSSSSNPSSTSGQSAQGQGSMSSQGSQSSSSHGASAQSSNTYK